MKHLFWDSISKGALEVTLSIVLEWTKIHCTVKLQCVVIISIVLLFLMEKCEMFDLFETLALCLQLGVLFSGNIPIRPLLV